MSILRLTVFVLFVTIVPLFFSSQLNAAPALRASSELSEAQRETLHGFDIGGIRSIRFLTTPRAFRDSTFFDEFGESVNLAAFEGKIVLVNLWGTWCAPCIREMPALNRLQESFDSSEFQIIPINFEPGGNEAQKARRLFEQQNIDHLPIYTDNAMRLSKEMGVISRPVTAILGRDGRELGRMTGDAEWDSEAAIEMIQYLIDITKESEE